MVVKRIFDIITSVLGLIIAFPLFLIIIIVIKINMSSPIFFIQKRIGRYGRYFKMIKFRTMYDYNYSNNISIKGESRITTLGALLRKYKLDELPELVNVFKGDMSFVGPRPDVPGYADKLKGDERKILKLRPGITSPASIKYRNEEELLAKQSDPIKYNDKIIYPDKVRLNLNYYKHRNFWSDLKIIIYTVLGKDLEEEYYN